MTLGVGAGQMSRIDSAKIASIKAEAAQLPLAGSAVASDAFFPFRDGLDVVVDAGAACVIQPGGSMRDDEVIAAANERGIAMVFTGVRHFRTERVRRFRGRHGREAPRSRRARAGVHRPPRHRRAGPLARLDAEGRAADLFRQPPEPLRLGADLGRAAARPARGDAADRGARLLDRDPAQALDHARDLQRGLRQPPAPQGRQRRRRGARSSR